MIVTIRNFFIKKVVKLLSSINIPGNFDAAIFSVMLAKIIYLLNLT